MWRGSRRVPQRTSARLLAAAIVFTLLFVHVHDARAAGLVDPFLRFRSLPTEHFVIYFHQGQQSSAARLARIAEEVWQSMSRSALGVPLARTHVLLADQSELANGFATPLPRNVIFLGARWPGGSEVIGNTDDWLRYVFTHEFTHIVHLDRSAGWARVVRRVFGRTPLAFPNLFLPAWQIEGLATFEESLATGRGRLHAGDFRAITREAARKDRLEPLDRVNGGLIDWPGGGAQYAYGAGFHAYLADTYGADKLGVLADATARRVPYTASRVFKPVFGKPLGDLWKDYQTHLVQSTAKALPGSGAAQLTHHGFVVTGPRFASDGEIIYSTRNPDAFPSLNSVLIDGSRPQTLTTRFLGSTTAVTRDAIYFDQLEYSNNVALYSDLYQLDRQTSRVRRLNVSPWPLRQRDPDISPDGRTLVYVETVLGLHHLVTQDIANPGNGATLLWERDTDYGAPRWSPDGRTVAVERHALGGLSEVVLVDVESLAVRRLAELPDTRIVTPAWRPDGRAVIAAVAPKDEPFDLYEFPIDGSSPRRLTNLPGGAIGPDVSPNGNTIVFVGYTVDGQDLFTMPYTAGETGGAQGRPLEVLARPVPAELVPPLDGSAGVPYQPWSTLKPTSWFPIVESDADQTRVGAGVSGVDVLGYHGYAVGATWLVLSRSDAIRPAAGRPDWFAYYAYSRWRPVFWFSASAQTSFFAGPPTDQGTPTPATSRENEIEAGVAFPVRHARTSHTTTAMFHRAVDDVVKADGTSTRNRTALRGAFTAVTAKTFGYSISPEKGFAAGVTTELVRPAFGALADATTFTADVRAYLPTRLPHHVAAVRLAAGRSTGNVDMRRTFLLGGPGPNRGLGDFARDAASLLRGFEANRFAGTHVVLFNADYRFPLARPQRGKGTWPLFLQTLHAAVFVDAGHAWTRGFRAADFKTSVGLEVSADLTAGFFFPLTATVGVAKGHDGAGSKGGAIAYVRIGRAF